MKHFIVLILFSFFLQLVIAQLPVGEWNNYQSYSSARKVVDDGEIIYCETLGGLFTYNKADQSIQKLSNINGLSDVGVETLGYGEKNNTVVVAYSNSNIDLIQNKDIYNISDIKRKQIMSNKSINNVFFIDEYAYLSCGFGIVVLNTEKKEIKDTYYIGENSSPVNVWDITSDNTYLYASTGDGVYRASLDEPNLLDYSNWTKLQNLPYPDGNYNQIEYFNGSVVVNYSTGDRNDEIYRLQNNSWNRIYNEVKEVFDIKAYNDRIVITNKGDVYIFDINDDLIEKIYQYIFTESQSNGIDPRDVVFDKNGGYWIADDDYSLVKKLGGNYSEVSPEGPIEDDVFALNYSGDALWISKGGRNAFWGNLWNQPLFQKYKEGSWTAFNPENYSEMQGLHDLICVITDPNNSEHVFAGLWGGGIFEFIGDEFVKQHSYHNSSLQTIIPNENYTTIGGMAFDEDGTLWVTNGNVTNVLSSYKDGEWQSYSIPDLAHNGNLGTIIITDDGDKWIARSNRDRDIYVVKGDNEDGKWQANIAYFSNGQNETLLYMHEVYCMAKDMDGAIWVGSSNGVAVYDDPSRIWNDPEQDPLARYARQPGIDLSDGIYHPLLEGETVTSIAVDAANRKWCGTKRSGIFLVSEEGEQELAHYTTDNSPLLSNEITSIAINNKTGEIFMGTSKGIISYVGEAIEAKSTFSDVYVYPNPVRENHNGPIVITGLMEDSDVKITDISGNLVYQTSSIGGQANWSGNNLNGKRCHTGVYLVFLNDKDGEETFATKILFIH